MNRFLNLKKFKLYLISPSVAEEEEEDEEDEDVVVLSVLSVRIVLVERIAGTSLEGTFPKLHSAMELIGPMLCTLSKISNLKTEDPETVFNNQK